MPPTSSRLGFVLLLVCICFLVAGLAGLIFGAIVIQRRRYLRVREHLGGRLLRAQDEERARVARELHDDVVQRLIVVSRSLHSTLPGTERDSVALDAVIDDLRQMARHLHPAAVDMLPTAALLDQLVTAAAYGTVLITCHTDDTLPDMGPAERLALFRVAQEAISNAVRHADATAIAVRLTYDDSAVMLAITDDGRGFVVTRTGSTLTLGITSMRERMALLGGQLVVRSRPGEGTCVRAILPR